MICSIVWEHLKRIECDDFIGVLSVEFWMISFQNGNNETILKITNKSPKFENWPLKNKLTIFGKQSS